MAWVAKPAERFGTAVLDALLPARCLACPEPVGAPGALCPACWSALAFIAPPLCACCGVPFEFEGQTAHGVLCGACVARAPVFARARSALRYGDGSRSLILRFKHGDRTHAAPAFGRWLARAGAELLADADVILPVPLHWTRLFARRYNQAALLAQALGRESGCPVLVDGLERRRRTPSQARLGRAGRARNVRGAFAVPAARRARIEGRRVLLVDDVLTTGATMEACARSLLSAGATAVDALTLARVVQVEDAG
ncbi:MAG: ComF family protein [Rhodospirillaceae bacterium]|jgi:ComF family protein|nr:ComF family protein [Rhodospirillaceae bacterium]